MAKSKVVDLPPTPSRLEHGDLTQMLLAERDLAVAKAELERDMAKREAYQLAQHIQAQKSEQQIKEAKARHEQAANKHRQLVDAFAVRYSIDWARTAFIPETGEIVTTE